MCGVAGYVGPASNGAKAAAMLRDMGTALAHRGPDDSGVSVLDGAGLVSRRLSILDLSPRGHMPMATPDGRYWMAYNGEVYNYRDLRRDLEKDGEQFVSGTDTEVVLRLYARLGPTMLDRLNGMFALAIWDTRDRTLFLARDRLGVKPLYYAPRPGGLLFASEAKALFVAGVPARFDPDTLEELLCFRFTAGERTTFAGVSRLLPGHTLTWKDGSWSVRRWWNLGERARALADRMPPDPVAWFRDTFDDAVRLRLISDVPVGVLLSGGLDSGTVAAATALQHGPGCASFTVRFDEPRFDEGQLARVVASRWGFDVHEHTVSPADLLDLLDEASYLNDEPLAHGNDPHLLAISEVAKPRVTVLLSGEGGDEMLGGYVRYRPLRHPGILEFLRSARVLHPVLRRLGPRGAKLARFLDNGHLRSLLLFNACDVLPADLEPLGLKPTGQFGFRERILAEAGTVYPDDLVRQAMYSDAHTFLVSVLDRNDRMTMGASIECRVPFLDYRLVEGLAALPGATLFRGPGNKPLLRRAMGDRLPPQVLRHPKWGFGVPWGRYFREVPEFRDAVSRLPHKEPWASGILNRAALGQRVAAFLAGDDGQGSLIRSLFLVAAWHRACLGTRR